MHVLLDECLDERLRHSLTGHDCETARYAGFASLRNGWLLSAAELAGFDVLVTIDRGMQFQQNLAGRKISLLIIQAQGAQIRHLLSRIPAVLEALRAIQPGEVVVIG
jgi:hypothetical protein